MDHKLALVIAPLGSVDPVAATTALLEQFQKTPADPMPAGFAPKFRFKAVGGWFDGQMRGKQGTGRWESVLHELLPDPELTSTPHDDAPAAPSLQGQLGPQNTMLFEDVVDSAPFSVIVTPDGEWFSETPADHGIDREPDLMTTVETQAWEEVKRKLLAKYKGYTAVGWDLSWYFIGVPAGAMEGHHTDKYQWSSPVRIATKAQAWAQRLAYARQVYLESQARSEEAVPV